MHDHCQFSWFLDDAETWYRIQQKLWWALFFVQIINYSFFFCLFITLFSYVWSHFHFLSLCFKIDWLNYNLSYIYNIYVFINEIHNYWYILVGKDRKSVHRFQKTERKVFTGNDLSAGQRCCSLITLTRGNFSDTFD